MKMNFVKDERKTATYKCGVYVIDLVEYDLYGDGKMLTEAWLSDENYGVKMLMFAYDSEELESVGEPAFDVALRLAIACADNNIKIYKENYAD